MCIKNIHKSFAQMIIFLVQSFKKKKRENNIAHKFSLVNPPPFFLFLITHQFFPSRRSFH